MKNFRPRSAFTAGVAFFVFAFVLPITTFAAGPGAINLGSAGNFVILSKTGISTTGSTSVVGDLGLSPAAASYITGFALTLPTAGSFSTSALVTGKIYAPGYADPTSSTLTTAVLDMQTAYTDGAGRTNPTATELGAGNIGGMTLAPGLYKWGTGVTIPTDVTLSGSANDVWIFVIGQTLTMSSGTHIIVSGGAQPSNIFWVVAGQTTIGTTAIFNGNILDQTAIVLNTGATLNGRALAQTAVTLDSNAVTIPTSVASTYTPPPTPSSTTTVCPGAQYSCPCATGNYCVAIGAMCINSASACPTSTPASTQTQTSSTQGNTNIVALQAQLNGLMATAQSLQAQVQARGSISSVGASFGQSIRTIAGNLQVGNRGADVTILQQFLISQNKGSAALALGNAGATAYFGTLTHAALSEFQASVGINPASGFFGPITRSYISIH